MVNLLPMIAAFLGVSILSDEDGTRPLYHVIFKWNDGAFIARLIEPFNRIYKIAPKMCRIKGHCYSSDAHLSLSQITRAFFYYDGTNYFFFTFSYGNLHTFFMQLYYSVDDVEVVGQRICWLLKQYMGNGEFSVTMRYEYKALGMDVLSDDYSAEMLDIHRQRQEQLSLLGAPDQVDSYEATVYQTNDTSHSFFMMSESEFMATIGVEPWREI